MGENITMAFSKKDARRWFFEWLEGMGSLYVTKEAKLRRDEALRGWLNELGGLGSEW